MERYLIDTNVISDYFSATLPENGLQFMDTVMDAIPNLSVITKIELLCWKTNFHLEEKIKDFVTDSRIFDISPQVIDYCVNVRKSKKIKTPDAIIAATALAHQFKLITRNIKDFKNIDRLELINPHEM